MKLGSLFAVGTAVAVLSPLTNAHAMLQVLDEPFSVGYGFTTTAPNTQKWATNETALVNTPTSAPNPDGSSFTIGDFTFKITVINSFFGTDGPIFTNRTLSNGSGGNVAQSKFTTITISSAYTGPNPPLDAEPGPTGFQLNIDQISVYALKHPAVSGTTNELWMIESTGTNPGTSSTNILNESGFMNVASNFVQLAWNPGEFFVASGTNDTRTFSFPTDRNFALDGLEIIGSGSYSYTIPEPSSLALILAGALFIRRRRVRL